MTTPIVLPSPLKGILEASTRALLDPGDRSSIDFSRPTGEAALVSPELGDRGACSRTRFRFSSAASPLLLWNSPSRACALVCGSTRISV